MKYVSNDGKEFKTENECKAYENKQSSKSSDALKKAEENRLSMLATIKDFADKIEEYETKMNCLIHEYLDIYDDEDQINDLVKIFEYENENEDEDEEECCESPWCVHCDDTDECMIETAIELVSNFEKLQKLVHILD